MTGAPRCTKKLKLLHEDLLRGKESKGLPWLTAWAFVRISTDQRLNVQALTAEETFAIIGEVRAYSLVTMVNSGRHQDEVLEEQMQLAQVRGRETTDAVHAALAIENRAALAPGTLPACVGRTRPAI